jgi:hypothetical protein
MVDKQEGIWNCYRNYPYICIARVRKIMKNIRIVKVLINI